MPHSTDSATDALIDRLIVVDLFIAAGTAAFDRLVTRITGEDVDKLRRDGVGEGAVQAFADERAASCGEARTGLQRELFDKGAAQHLGNLPAPVLNDLYAAGVAVRAGLHAADRITAEQLDRYTALRARNAELCAMLGEEPDPDEADAPCCPDAARATLHRRLWGGALPLIMKEA